MSPRETAVLDAIELHYRRYGCPPTIRYIMDRVDIPSTSVVHYYYRRLAKAKLIVMAGGPGSQRKPVPVEIYKLIRSRHDR